MKSAITIRRLSALTGYSAATVSYALRGESKIGSRTRSKVLAAAKRLGYRRSPLVSTVMSSVRRGNRVRMGGTIVGLTWWRAASSELNETANRQFWRGATRRAASLGWSLKEVKCDRENFQFSTIDEILSHSSTAGLLVGSLPTGHGELSLNLSGLSCVTWGYSLRKPLLHRVCIHHGHAMRLAFAEACRLGYRRIGLAITERQNLRADSLWETNFTIQQENFAAGTNIEPLLSRTALPAKAEIEAWLRDARPDVVLTTLPLRPYLIALGIRAKLPAFIDLDHTGASSHHGGVDLRHVDVGATAIDIVVGQIHANEHGVPEIPKLVLIEGLWVNGPLLGSDNLPQPARAEPTSSPDRIAAGISGG